MGKGAGAVRVERGAKGCGTVNGPAGPELELESPTLCSLWEDKGPQQAVPAVLGLSTLLMGPMSVFEGAVEVRLEDGSGRCAGRVEVKHQGQWGTVCDDYWGMDDAAVVCKQLDCGSAVEAHWQGYFGRGSGPIWLDDVGCTGTESALSDCTHRGWGEHSCVDGEEAGVTCSGFMRLVEGKSRCLGRVEIRDGDQWKSVCGSHFGPKAADVVCRELQCGTALHIPGAAHFGEGVSPSWDGELQCVGNESLLASCPRGPPRDQPCTHANSAIVICTLFEGAAEVRLADGGKHCAERVEVKQQGKWGTVCGDYWDMHNAAVVCKQLGCGSAVGAPQYGHFGPGSGPIWMNEGGCNSTESALSDCTHRGWGENSCNHASDTRVMCSGAVRLVEGKSHCLGRVEIRDGDQWKSVCGSHFGPKAADVVCRELQCGTALPIPGAAHFGEGVSPSWDRELQCVGNESLASCTRGAPRDQPCTHANSAVVTCTRDSGGPSAPPMLPPCFPGYHDTVRQFARLSLSDTATPSGASPGSNVLPGSNILLSHCAAYHIQAIGDPAGNLPLPKKMLLDGSLVSQNSLSSIAMPGYPGGTSGAISHCDICLLSLPTELLNPDYSIPKTSDTVLSLEQFNTIGMGPQELWWDAGMDLPPPQPGMCQPSMLENSRVTPRAAPVRPGSS
ncbi:scavenger receptor cysteine-rich domain-containing group B protein-like [Nyctibius grandis]|uniref:scavenger receptor cysteine-rich domain-containing group B protein-like n=1 Tax=Nyctibius grandis TaxID=48427 RepID=UPI0035BC67EB